MANEMTLLPPLVQSGLTNPPITLPPPSWETIFAAIDQLTRRAAREEYERLSAEQAAATAEADENQIIDTVRTAAAVLNVREQTVYEWIKDNKLKSYKVGRAVRLKRSDVLAALKAQTLPDGRRKYARRAATKQKSQ